MPFDASPEVLTPVADVLTRARRMIENPEAWGRCTDNISSSGPRRCAILALGAVSKAPQPVAFFYLYHAIGGRLIASWNDDPGTTHADVMDAFSRAIESARRAGR